MDKLQVDFGKLVHETCDFQGEMASGSWPPNSPGIFYQILQQAYTYQIMAIPDHNMRNHGPQWPFAKDGGHYFATPSFELAQVIADSVANKRFPKAEETFYNIGDPTENWWMVFGDNFFKILFRSHGLQESSSCGHALLGPLGDSGVAVARFQQLKGHLRNCFPLFRMEVSPKMIRVITLRSEDGAKSAGFEQFRCLFQEGEVPKLLLEEVDRQQFPSVFYYLNELAIMRRFWVQIYQLLN